jgi:hypothetical protein
MPTVSRSRIAAALGAEEGKGQLLDVVVFVQAGLVQRLFEAA